MDMLTSLNPASLTVVCAPAAAREQASLLAACLALRGQVTILDCGNRLQPYRIAQLLRQHTADISSAVNHIHLRRAFTCHQVCALLEDTLARSQPYLVLDLLGGFYDEHVPAHQARRLLERCLRQFERLSRTAPVLVTLAPPPLPERAFLIDLVCEHADQVLISETPAPNAFQPALF